MSALRCYVQPGGNAASALDVRVARAGLEVVADPTGADAVVWSSNRPDGLGALLARAPAVRWVQLPIAGIERFVPLVRSHAGPVVWTCAKVAYGPAVAEMTVGLLITAFRQLHRYVAARSWQPLRGRVLAGATVCVLGAGGIGRSLVAQLEPFGAEVVVVTRSGAPVAGARVARSEGMTAEIAAADAVVVAVPLTEATTGLVDRRFLEAMKESAWLVNVARGPVVVTDDLVDALRRGVVAGAALDVTDPEPLPDDHPLWELENALVTPHVANTPALGAAALGELVEENARRFAGGQPLLGVVDPLAGY
ncbi:MAG: NAD(P)-dependent oxidoreductase [Acidimicrobiales bacterium]